MFKIIKINAKKGLFCASPRGCDVALKATWQRHVDRRKCLRGTMMMCDETKSQGRRFHAVSRQKLFRTYQFGELRVN